MSVSAWLGPAGRQFLHLFVVELELMVPFRLLQLCAGYALILALVVLTLTYPQLGPPPATVSLSRRKYC